jgi:serpin B
MLPILIVISLISCSGGGNSVQPSPKEPTGDYTIARSNESRDLAPGVPDSQLNELVTGNTDFAIDLYNEVKDTSDNILFSPYSISIALAMTYAGARNNTESQMADVFNFTLGQEGTHPALNKLDLELNSRGDNVDPKDRFQLNITNSIWGENTWTFLPSFLDTIARNYGAGLRLVDFMNQPEASRVTINDWVEIMTNDKIQDLIQEGMITNQTVMVLVNAIYFNAQWKNAFIEESTAPQPFHTPGGDVTCQMMSLSEEFGYAKGNGYEAVDIPYTGDELSMLCIVPDAGTFDDFESNLTADSLNSITSGLQNVEGSLKMPKFEFEMNLPLSDVLFDMGMSDAFSPGIADFSGMDGTLDLYIQFVIHKAFISVDEAGTEAAAATAVGIGFTSAPIEEFNLTIDRPFIFMIRDRVTGSILFLGRVTDPTA